MTSMLSMKGDQLLYEGKKTKSIWAQTLFHPRGFSNNIPLSWIEGNNTLPTALLLFQMLTLLACCCFRMATRSGPWQIQMPTFVKLIKPFTIVAMPIIDRTRYLQLGTFTREINSLSYQTHGNTRCLCGPREVTGEMSNTHASSFPVLPAHFAKQWIT